MIGPIDTKRRKATLPGHVLMAAAWLFCAPVHADQATLYNESQAARGALVYEQFCTSCHGAQLQGNPAAPLAGAPFQSLWMDGQHSLDDLYYIVRTQMPYNAPASLSKQQYVDVLAFVLKANGFAGGGAELPPQSAALRSMMLAPH
jgi:cytochrome c